LLQEKKILSQELNYCKNKTLVARKNILGYILRIIILQLRMSFFIMIYELLPDLEICSSSMLAALLDVCYSQSMFLEGGMIFL